MLNLQIYKKLKLVLRLILHAKYINLLHRKTGVVSKIVICAVNWSRGLPNTYFCLSMDLKNATPPNSYQGQVIKGHSLCALCVPAGIN